MIDDSPSSSGSHTAVPKPLAEMNFPSTTSTATELPATEQEQQTAVAVDETTSLQPWMILYPLATRMIAYKGIFQELHDQAQGDLTDGIRLLALQHADGPLYAYQEALEISLRKLKKPKSLTKLEVGMKLPKRASSAMKLLDDLLPIFELALHADQR